MYQWRRFQFFDKEPVKDEIASTIQKGVIHCATSGRGHLVFGYGDGYLAIVDREWNQLQGFQAYNHAVTHVQQLKQSNVLVTMGDDEEAISPTLKIWNLDKLDKNGYATCMKSVRITQQVPVTVIQATEDLNQVAVGLCNGIVVLIREILREKVPKQINLVTEGGSPVTGLGYKTQDKNVLLFVVTSDSVTLFYTSNKDIYKQVVDADYGCGVGCAIMGDAQDLVVARNEAVYFYEPEGRGSCFAFEGEKKMLYWFRSYLIVVGQDPNNVKFNTFSIYDLKNKFIAYSENRFQNITFVTSEWGSIFIFTGDSKIFQLEEKDTQTKLETLFKKNLYSVAIDLAQSQNLDQGSIVDIFRKYGDHLYSKGDYDGAMSQYIKTIGKLEPSYIIRKFLDAQRIKNLTSYLQALHEKGLANADHTTLLFNCYTKLKDVQKLDQFIKTESDMNFDAETAIKACRQAGYYEHALYVAQRHNDHESYLKILLEDLRRFNDALAYIATLEFYEAEKNMKKYGKILVTNLPDLTTELLKRLCSNYTPSKSSNATSNVNTNASTQPSNALSSSVRSVPLLNSKDDDKDRNELFARSSPSTYPNNTPPSSMSAFSSSLEAPSSSASTTNAGNSAEFIHTFVNQPEWLIKFLDFIVTKGLASAPIYNTLLELYLREETVIVENPISVDVVATTVSKSNNNNNSNVNQDSTTTPNVLSDVKIRRVTLSTDEIALRRKQALALLVNPQSKYEDEYALVLCKLHDFREGLLYLYEKLQLYKEILEYHMEHNQLDAIITACKSHGSKDPNLWVQALSYFANKKEECSKEISEVLFNIDRGNMLPPLLVIQILSQKPTATLSLIKDYISRRLQAENQMIAEDAKQIKTYKEETKKMRTEIYELKTSAKVFQLNKCTYCGHNLDLPAVHFLCMHSFHQRCLGENELECPTCAPQNKKILEIKKNLEENVGQHDQFFKQLENSPDGFTVVSEYFGRGVFNKRSAVDDARKL